MIFDIKNPCSVVISYDVAPVSVSVTVGGVLYYFRRNLNKEKQFTLNLIIAGKICAKNASKYQIKGKPTIYEPTFLLPTPDRNKGKSLINPIVVFNRTLKNTPARIFHKENKTPKIEVSPRFKSYPLQIQSFIILHELGHFYYKSEENADKYALYHFLKSGGNLSQALYSLTHVLQCVELSKDRINHLLQQIKQTKRK